MEVPYDTSSAGPPLLPARAEFLKKHKELKVIIENYRGKAKTEAVIVFLSLLSLVILFYNFLFKARVKPLIEGQSKGLEYLKLNMSTDE